MKPIYLIPLLISIPILWHILIFRLAARFGLIKLNFNKLPIMASYGIVSIVYITAIMIGLVLVRLVECKLAAIYLSGMGAMWVLGVIDDVWGTREVGGFKGHFKKLILEHKLTTGAVKALGGGLVGIGIGWWLSDGNTLKWIIAAMLIPLASNILNLFDLRPGRAVAVFLFGLVVTCAIAGADIVAPWLVGTIAAVTLIFSVLDSKGKAMMGDSGSNMLGAAMGITMVLNTGLIFQITAIMIIVAIHIYSEKNSVSALIERNPVLRFIDRRLGVR